jgi:hypothetical protein
MQGRGHGSARLTVTAGVLCVQGPGAERVRHRSWHGRAACVYAACIELQRHLRVHGAMTAVTGGGQMVCSGKDVCVRLPTLCACAVASRASVVRSAGSRHRAVPWPRRQRGVRGATV